MQLFRAVYAWPLHSPRRSHTLSLNRNGEDHLLSEKRLDLVTQAVSPRHQQHPEGAPRGAGGGGGGGRGSSGTFIGDPNPLWARCASPPLLSAVRGFFFFSPRTGNEHESVGITEDPIAECFGCNSCMSAECIRPVRAYRNRFRGCGPPVPLAKARTSLSLNNTARRLSWKPLPSIIRGSRSAGKVSLEQCNLSIRSNDTGISSKVSMRSLYDSRREHVLKSIYGDPGLIR
jgi:hypothetical protein